MRIYILFIFICSRSFMLFAQDGNCNESAYPAPSLSDSVKNVFDSHLAQAEKKYKNSKSAENIIWYGRRLAYLGKYKEAIEIYSEGISLYPGNARFYRHRGHRYITLRCFDKAIADLLKAATLTEGQIDELEEDGIPNAMNIPVSTLQTNIYYHLGLAYFLKEENANALRAFERCADLSSNDDMMVAALNWINLLLRKMDRNKEADERLGEVTKEMNLIENRDYHDLLMMYKTGREKEMAARIQYHESLSNATMGFGLGMYYLFKGDKKKAKEIFQKIIKGNQWSSFGFIAAEAALRKLQSD